MGQGKGSWGCPGAESGECEDWKGGGYQELEQGLMGGQEDPAAEDEGILASSPPSTLRDSCGQAMPTLLVASSATGT